MTNANRKGLLLFVYRDAEGGDCTNGGISSRCTKLTLVGPGVPEVFEPRDDAPAVILDHRGNYFFLRPEDEVPADHCGWMAGGNLAGTSDSRFCRLMENRTGASIAALPIHDRADTWETYYALTR